MENDVLKMQLKRLEELRDEAVGIMDTMYAKMTLAAAERSPESIGTAVETGEKNRRHLREVIGEFDACVGSIERLERSLTIKEHVEDNRIWLDDITGEQVAEILFPEVEEGVVNITHTEVDPFYGGQGLAGALTERAAERFRERGLKCMLSCSYAIKWFNKHPEYSDVLKDPKAEKERAEMPAGPACSIRKEG